MMINILPLIFILSSLHKVNAATFNVAFAAGTEARIESLLNEPWTRALDPLAAAFNSRYEW
jgi:hypothetical protein